MVVTRFLVSLDKAGLLGTLRGATLVCHAGLLPLSRARARCRHPTRPRCSRLPAWAEGFPRSSPSRR